MRQMVAAVTKPVSNSCQGSYSGYIEDLERRKGPDADQPHRIAYGKLVRA